MWLKWLPWRFVVRRIARARGFVDPISLLSHLHRFAQPSEVAAPLELLRAGVVFHARGLMNTGAIQHNLDWVWPYWVERQFDPSDESFIPRAFSITHVNLTHRNWTAVGWPDHDWLPIVDPRGLVTPFWDSWSLDAWIVSDDGRELLPSRVSSAAQRLTFDNGVTIETDAAFDGLSLRSATSAGLQNHSPYCKMHVTARADAPAWLAICLLPYNPEGVSFIHKVALSADKRRWDVDDDEQVHFTAPPERHAYSTYREGDVHTRLKAPDDGQLAVNCDVGMATAAALYRLEPDTSRKVEVHIPLRRHSEAGVTTVPHSSEISWQTALGSHARLEVPDEQFQFLYDAAVRTMILHSPGDVYPGPYTYKRFWFRDAAFILNAMLCAGQIERVEPVLELFAKRQTRKGYFLSQEGEWDSNGEALWILNRYRELAGKPVKEGWLASIRSGAKWITGKLTANKPENGLHAGLLPAGFSAEHLGPNDYYYWDDFWAVAGLRAAAEMLRSAGDRQAADRLNQEAKNLLQIIDRSIVHSSAGRAGHGIPASPYRRMDAGAIGSVVVGYPLALCEPSDPRLLKTVDFLIERSFYRGGFFQDMIHSGINPYLTLHVAQVLLRAGDERYLDLMQSVAAIASPTGQWPEAVHPRTLGGCMGDGQHVWAAAEWVMMIRNCFVREENGGLILASGIPAVWLEEEAQRGPISFGPAPTPYGPITVSIAPDAERVTVNWRAQWRAAPPTVEVRLAGFEPLHVQSGQSTVVLERVAAR